jgi:RHS repeat-associated protein
MDARRRTARENRIVHMHVATTTYEWDYANRLIALGVGAGGTTTYGYDAFGARVLQTGTSTTTIYPFKWYSVASSTGSGAAYATTTSYVWNGETLVSTVDQQTAAGAATGTPQTRYIHPDHLGSTNVVTNASGTVVQTLDYFPYGAQRINSGTNVSDRQYIGERYDANTDLNYLNARYYQSSRGQFLSQDPIFLEIGGSQSSDGRRQTQAILSDPQLLNSYSYARNNPIILTDKSGKFIDISWISNSQWAQESATAAYQQGGAWKFAFDHPNTTSAIVGISAIPGLVSGGSAIAAFQMAGSAGVGATFAAQQAFAGAVYSALSIQSTVGIPGVVNQFSQLNPNQPKSIFGPAASMVGVGLSLWGGYPGAIADAFQFAGLLNQTLGKAANNLFSNSVQARQQTACDFNTKSGGSGGSGGGAPSNNSLWVTPSGAVVTFGGQLVSAPPTTN